MRGRKGGRGEKGALSARQRRRPSPRLSWDYLQQALSNAPVLVGLSSFKPGLILLHTPSQGSSFPRAHQGAQHSHTGKGNVDDALAAHKNLPQLCLGTESPSLGQPFSPSISTFYFMFFSPPFLCFKAISSKVQPWMHQAGGERAPAPLQQNLFGDRADLNVQKSRM